MTAAHGGVRTRALQVAFLVLLGVCVAQLAWWLVDEYAYTTQVRDRMRGAYAEHTVTARALLDAGVPWEEVARRHPRVVLDPGDSSLSVAPDVLAALDEQRFRRLNRFAWEGAFFLVVLLAAMSVVYRALRREAQLRQHQDQFLAAVSHELKSPLASLRLSVETLALRDPPPERRAELVQRLLADLGRLQRMIINILDVSRLAEARTGGPRDSLALATEVASVVDEVREQAREARVTLATEIPADVTVFADRERVRSIVRNLLHNAMRAAPGGTVTARATPNGTVVHFEVRDDGRGFPPDEGTRLFDRFYRGPAEATAEGGTGLGLFITRRCAELDGGTATAASDGPGRGAVFTVTWPAGRQEPS